ncbi:M20 family metallopeptidase [Microbacterium tumbae]
MTVRERETIALLRRLMGHDSTTGTDGERRALHDAADIMRALTGDADAVRVATGGDAFVVLPPAVEGRVLLFSCHIDTVPAGDPADWEFPPFDAVVESGFLHGRGASDMKSGLAAAMTVVAEGIAAGSRVALAVTIGEEAGCLGAPAVHELLTPRERADVAAVIVPESTGNRIALGHRGAYWLTAGAEGVAAHGSTPERGENAVLKISGVLGELGSLPLRTHSELGAETVNVGTFTGGLAHNIVPAGARVGVDHRVVDADVSAIERWWTQRVDHVRTDLRLDPVWSDASDPWIRSLPAPLMTEPVAYFTDASVLVRSLNPGTPIVVWGPGDPTGVHAKDEKVSLEAVVRALENYRVVVEAWSKEG